MIHGWSQSAALFKKNIPELSKHYQVTAVDVRGHGESDKPAHGYRVSRFATDMHELICHLGLKEVNILGWSMGCSVIWSYWELFGADRLSKMILVDEPGWLMKTQDNPYGMLTYDELVTMCKNILKDYPKAASDLIRGLVTTDLPEEEIQFMIDENMKIPKEYSARLAYIHWLTDWRDIIPTITLPTLIISGKKSFVNWKSQAWNNEHIPGSKIVFFEGRGHIMFFEEPEKFNRAVEDFIG